MHAEVRPPNPMQVPNAPYLRVSVPLKLLGLRNLSGPPLERNPALPLSASPSERAACAQFAVWAIAGIE